MATEGRDGGDPGGGSGDSGTPASARKRALALRVYQGGKSTRLTDLLAKLAQGGRQERLEAARTLAGIQSKRSVVPLLVAAEGERDAEVRAALLEAINELSNCGEFWKPLDTVSRLEALLFAETDPEVTRVANLALYYLTPGGTKVSAEKYFRQLLARAEAELGVEHAVTRSIQGMSGYCISADLF